MQNKEEVILLGETFLFCRCNLDIFLGGCRGTMCLCMSVFGASVSYNLLIAQ